MRKVEGPRTWLVAELERLAEGWWHLGKDDTARDALRAAEALRHGESFADAGHTEYVPVAHTTRDEVRSVLR